MNLIKLFLELLELLGLCWIVLTIMIEIFGGSIDIKIKNPMTKKIDTITNIMVDRKKR